MNQQNMDVLVNIIGAVESGGQIYGRRDYAAYAPPYTNSEKEYTITLGWAQNYGAEAKHLIQMIFDSAPVLFSEIDINGSIKGMLSHDWVKEKWNPTDEQKEILITLITSDPGRVCQDKLFGQLMEQFIKECAEKYTDDVKAQMMYCEIRHLGGQKPVTRIFDRLNGDYSLDAIMTSLIKDQRDTSSNNQVGDAKFWSRHLKCKIFIEQYAVGEEKEGSKMVIIGSARIDENGNVSGGKAGDQTGNEVSIQEYYLHKKGWRVIRAKRAEVREAIAMNMEWACANDKIGYDQGQNQTLYEVAEPLGFNCSLVVTPCETDCARLVRVCVLYAGVDVSDFYTTIEADALLATGEFEEVFVPLPTGLLRGDILVTPVKGHTVVALTNGDGTTGKEADTNSSTEPVAGKYTVGWHKNNVGWWYADTVNTYLVHCWKVIDHHYYYFDDTGYMLKGWQIIDGKMYYLQESNDNDLEGALWKSDGSGAQSVWYVE